MILFYLFVLVNLAYVPLLSDPFLLPKKLLLIAGCLASLIVMRKKKISIPPEWLSILVLMLFGIIVASYNSRFPWISFNEGLFYISLFPLIWMSRESFTTSESKHKAARWLCHLAVGQIIIGIGQLLFLAHSSGVSALRSERYFAGTFGNSEYFAYFLGCVFFLSLKLERKIWFQILIIAALAVTRCKSAWVSVFIGYLIFEPKLSTILVRQRLFTSIVVLSVVVLGYFEWLSGLKGRLLLDWLSLKSIASHSFMGAGFGSFEFQTFSLLGSSFENPWILKEFSKYASLSTRVHNEFLDFLVEGGILFTIGLIWLLFAYIRSWNLKNTLGKSLLTFIFLMSLLSFPLHIPENIVLTFLMFSLVFERSWDSIQTNINHEVEFKTFSQTIGLLLAITLFSYGQQSFASFFAREAQIYWQQDKPELANLMATKSLSLHYPSPSTLVLKSQIVSTFDRPQSERLLGKAWENGVTTIDVVKRHAYLLNELGSLDFAFEKFELLSKSYPNQITPYFKMALIRKAQRQYADARSYFEKASRMNPVSTKGKIEKFFSLTQLTIGK